MFVMLDVISAIQFVTKSYHGVKRIELINF